MPKIVHEQLEQMPSIFTKKFQQDVLYLRGKDEGIAEGKAEGIAEGIEKGIAQANQNTRAMITLLLSTGQFGPQEIAHQSGVPLELVLSVQADMEKRSEISESKTTFS